MARDLRIVAYAVNGGGIGHLNRLVAISRWLRRYASFVGRRAEIYFLTSSEADGLLVTEGLAGFKLPSPTAAHDSGLNMATYTAMAKQWIWHSIGLLQPDLLIVDTWPRGSYGELLSALDLCKRKAFIYRPVRDEISQAGDFQAMLPMYDRIIVPEYEESAHVPMPSEARELTRFVGPVMNRERSEQHTRTEARDRLGIQGERLAVYISAGGGGDPTAEDHLLNVCTALADDPSLHLVVGAGPLYRGRVLNGDRVTWLAHGGVSELMNAFDLAVCAAGYNTFSELMHAGVPTVFVPQTKLADDQAARAMRAAEAGAAIVLDQGLVGVSIEGALEQLRDPQRRARAGEAARGLVPLNHARDAAAELLSLVVPPDQVDRAMRAVNDDVLVAARDCKLSYYAFVELMRALEHGQVEAEPIDGAEVATEAVELIRFMVERGISAQVGVNVTMALSQKFPLAGVHERAEVVRMLLPELAAFRDWTSVTAFLRMLNTERRLAATDLAEIIVKFLVALRGRQEDLYRGIAHISEAMAAGTYPAGLA